MKLTKHNTKKISSSGSQAPHSDGSILTINNFSSQSLGEVNEVAENPSLKKSIASSQYPISKSLVIEDNLDGIMGVAEIGQADEVLPPLLDTSSLKERYFVLPNDDIGKARVFIDRKLPSAEVEPTENSSFPSSYFVNLHERVAASGPTYPAGTPNHIGARIPLLHCKLKVDRWRYHLHGYEGVDICQMIEFGFPLGLTEGASPSLRSTYRNHGSAYQYFKWWDKMTAKGVSRMELTGPFNESPFVNVHLSPLMTAHKRPRDRRCVFDATFGKESLNNKTPPGLYLGQPMEYSYPKIEDFKMMILKSGRGCFMWKRDLSRYFLQIPLCPSEYHLVAFVWRCCLFLFHWLDVWSQEQWIPGTETDHCCMLGSSQTGPGN
jgi:hypothetical protein